VPAAPALKALGDFKADTLPLKILGDNNAEAVRIFDRVGWR
jgi:iron(III) transport system substrate-binding protein